MMAEEDQGRTSAWRKEAVKEALVKLLIKMPAFRVLASRRGDQPGLSNSGPATVAGPLSLFVSADVDGAKGECEFIGGVLRRGS